MRKPSDIPTRGEVTDSVQKHGDEMTEKGGEMDITTSDVEVTRETMESLDLGGTVEGADEVESSIQEAEDVTVDIFEEQDAELEDIQSDTEEDEQELRERSDTSESDLGKVSDASGRIETHETVSELVKTKEGLLRDIEFLDENADRDREAREESERIQQELENRVRGGGR